MLLLLFSPSALGAPKVVQNIKSRLTFSTQHFFKSKQESVNFCSFELSSRIKCKSKVRRGQDLDTNRTF